MAHLAKLLEADNPAHLGDCVRNYLKINAPDENRVLTPEESAAEKAKYRR